MQMILSSCQASTPFFSGATGGGGGAFGRKTGGLDFNNFLFGFGGFGGGGGNGNSLSLLTRTNAGGAGLPGTPVMAFAAGGLGAFIVGGCGGGGGAFCAYPHSVNSRRHTGNAIIFFIMKFSLRYTRSIIP